MTALFPGARRTQLDGSEVVVLTPDAYEQLDAIRRQAGAQATRIHALRERLAEATAALEEIAEAARHGDCPERSSDRSSRCLRDIVLSMPSRASQARPRNGSRSKPAAQRRAPA